MNVIDHTDTYALLIGASSFPEDAGITPIPNVSANLQLLKKSLADVGIVGIPEANITLSLNENRSQIEKKLRDIAEKTRNRKYTLVVYYTGHGILSSDDYQLYLTTHYTSKQDLEIDGINIEDFKKYIKKSIAGRKIVILDCCHSGAIIGAMGDMPSKIQSELNGFEGTYVITSAAEDTPSLFPVESPEQPTYFTGKLLEILNEGLDTDKEYCSLRDIYNKIEIDFSETGLPQPQQSNFNSADQLYFSVNKKYLLRKPADEIAWEETIKKNTKWAYVDFKNKFPLSVYTKEAKKKIYDIEENEAWQKASAKNTVSSLDDYMDNYPEGKYFQEAEKKITALREKEESLYQPPNNQQQEKLWTEAKQDNTIESFEKYIATYPAGKYANEAKNGIEGLKQQRAIEEKEKQEEEQEDELWKDALESNTAEAFQKYLKSYSLGKYAKDASKRIEEFETSKSDEAENIDPQRFNLTFLAIIAAGVILLGVLIYFIIQGVNKDSTSTYDNSIVSDSTAVPDTIFALKMRDTAVKVDVSTISLLTFKGLFISEDSIRFYKDYGELKNLKDTFGLTYNYKGGVLNNKPQGFGWARYKKGDHYVGVYDNGKMNDLLGLYVWADGTKYIGGFVNDMLNGDGDLTAPAGTEITNCHNASVYKGHWKNGEKSGDGKCYDEKGNLLYDGPFKNDKPINRYPSPKK